MRSLSQSKKRLLWLLAAWVFFYASFTLFTPPLLDGVDSVHAEMAREMVQSNEWMTVCVNGVRHGEIPPLPYWLMAGSMKLFGPYAAAARVPMALMVLGLAAMVWLFGSRLNGERAGFYASMVLLSSTGVFLFSRILISEMSGCLWFTGAMYCFWRLEGDSSTHVVRGWNDLTIGSGYGWGFLVFCVLGVLSEGLMGDVLPLTIAVGYLLLTRGWMGALVRVTQVRGLLLLAIFTLVIAPGIMLHYGRLYTQAWHANGEVPLWLFWMLLLVWMLPWSAFLFPALKRVKLKDKTMAGRGRLLLVLWAAAAMLLCSFGQRQEYSGVPALPALALLIGCWLQDEATEAESFTVPQPLVANGQRTATVMFVIGFLMMVVCGWLLLNAKEVPQGTDIAALLQQHPEEHHVLLFGSLLDLTLPAMGAFEGPLGMMAVAFGAGTAMVWWKRRQFEPHGSNLWIGGMAFTLLLAAHTGLRFFSPVLTSKQFADAIKEDIKPNDLIVIRGEYEMASTLAFYLRRSDLHLYDSRVSSMRPEGPKLLEDDASLRAKWKGSRRMFLWAEAGKVPAFIGRDYFVVLEGGGKQLIANYGKDAPK